MKKVHIVTVLCLMFVFINVSKAQSYSVWFTSPTSGSTVANVYNSEQVSVTVGFNASGTQHQYHKNWKFILKTNVGDFTTYDTTPFSNVYTPSGNLTWTLEMWEVLVLGDEYYRTQTSVNFNAKFKIYAANNFGSGNIYLESTNVSSGSSTNKIAGASVSVGAIDQNDGTGYYRVWNTNGTNNSYWWRNDSPIDGATPRNYSYTVASNDNGITLVADIKKVCNLEFVSAGGTVYVNGSHSSPYTANVIEQNSIYVSTNYTYYSDGLDYTFDHWASGGQPYSSPITANNHQTFTAIYTRKPSTYGRNLYFNGNVGDPIHFTWVDNPNSGVTQFQIWRRVTHNHVQGSATLLTTVNRDVETYTDYDYLFTNGYTNDLVSYDVRGYYAPDNIYSDENWQTTYGETEFSKDNNDKLTLKMNNETPKEYSISNYPNPFNPTTTINYQLPQDGYVTIKVYDILGREVAALVNENKTAGYYNVGFNASKLTSGVYIYTITANNFVQSKKLLLMK